MHLVLRSVTRSVATFGRLINLGFLDLSIICFIFVAQFDDDTRLPVSTVSCFIWFSIRTIDLSDFTLLDLASLSRSIFSRPNLLLGSFHLFSP